MAGKKEQILDAALKLFIEKGFHNTSTANISKEAGVATGTLFLYFPGKEDLINELYKVCKGQLGTVLRDSLPEEGSVRDKMFHIWKNACDWAYQNNHAFRFIYMFKSSPLISNLTREEINTDMDFAMSFFQQAMKAGEMIKMDIGLLLTIIDGLLSATVNYMAAHPDKKHNKVIDQSFEIFWNGIAL